MFGAGEKGDEGGSTQGAALRIGLIGPIGPMQNLITDIRFGWRSLLKRPGATMIALVTLALGIGVNTAIFSAVDSILLRPLPFKDPDRVVSVWEQTPSLGIQQNQAAPANFFDLRNQSQAFEALG